MAALAHIRAARTTDAQVIAEIWNPVIAQTAITFTTDLKTPEALAEDIARKGAAFQVACVAGEVVGFATYGPFRNGPGYAYTREHTIVLAPQARGHGAGRALMQAIEAVALAQDIHSLWAGVSGENPAGVRFHAAMGYREIARLPEVGYKFGRWMDLVLMQKLLSQQAVIPPDLG